MIVITDSNLIFSALITPKGTVAKIFNEQNRIQIFVPNFVFDEVNNHFEKILLLSPYTKFELIEKIKLLKQKIKIIKTKQFQNNILILQPKLLRISTQMICFLLL